MTDAERDEAISEMKVGLAVAQTTLSAIPDKCQSQQDQLNTLFSHQSTLRDRIQALEVWRGVVSGQRSGRSSVLAVISAVIAAIVSIGSLIISLGG